MRKICVIVASLAVCTAAVADPVIWDNGASIGTNALSSQLDTAYPFDSQMADDFVLAAGANVITDVHWTGLYFGGNPLSTLDFNVFIYGDAGGVPTGGPGDPSGTALKSWTMNGNQVASANPGEFDYSIDVSADPFVATPGTTYWIAIQSINFFPPQWGWSTSADVGGNAVQGFPFLGTPYWTGQGGTEQAYFLTGIPEPATLGLLAAGALALLRRRR